MSDQQIYGRYDADTWQGADKAKSAGQQADVFGTNPTGGNSLRQYGHYLLSGEDPASGFGYKLHPHGTQSTQFAPGTMCQNQYSQPTQVTRIDPLYAAGNDGRLASEYGLHPPQTQLLSYGYTAPSAHPATGMGQMPFERQSENTLSTSVYQQQPANGSQSSRQAGSGWDEFNTGQLETQGTGPDSRVQEKKRVAERRAKGAGRPSHKYIATLFEVFKPAEPNSDSNDNRIWSSIPVDVKPEYVTSAQELKQKFGESAHSELITGNNVVRLTAEITFVKKRINAPGKSAFTRLYPGTRADQIKIWNITRVFPMGEGPVETVNLKFKWGFTKDNKQVYSVRVDDFEDQLT